MAVRPPLLTCLLILTSAPLAAQQFKREVDGLIRFFRGTADPASHALGDGSCRTTAKVLVAMGHCHRLYDLSADGPVVRNPLRFLITCRQADGSFADAGDPDPVETTLWVLDALRAVAPQAYAAEIATATTWLGGKTRRTSAFAGVEAGKASLAAAAAQVARGPVMADGKPDIAATVGALLTLVRGQQQGRLAAVPPARVWTEVQQKAFDFLLQKQDDGRFYMMIPVGDSGKFMKHYDLGLTGMGIASLSTKPADLRTDQERKVIEAGLAWLIENQTRQGPLKGSFGKETINYTTCAAVMALHKNRRPEFEPALKLAQRFLVALQSVEGKGYAPSDRDYGSIGYGGDERGDLSNTQFGVQALRESGLDPQDEAFAKAIRFLQRTQNLQGSYQGTTRDSKTGKRVKVMTGNDGGAAYYPGNSPAGYIDLPDGSKIPRSYGSMTYALLKTYTLCGVPGDDPRVQAAVRWIGQNFSLDTNPGADPRLGEKARYQGLFYYYMVMAQALAAAGIEQLTVTDPQKPDATRQVDWRQELAARLKALQSPSGGWLNAQNGRWWEESDLVCTTYAMLALEHCK